MGQNRRSMNLDELRKALSSTATRQAERLKKENRQLRAEILEKSRIIDEQKAMRVALFNRCWTLTGLGATCFICAYYDQCERERTMGKRTEGET